MPLPSGASGRAVTKRKRKDPPKRTAPPRQADTGDRARARPAPKPVVKPVFQGPATAQRPFTAQRQEAQQAVRATRRRLPAPVLAAPPVISEPKGRPGGAKMTRGEVNRFLASQSKVTQAARTEIVKSMRANIGNVRGQERVEAVARLMDEIATDPRLAGTRKAIRHYTALEERVARPQTPWKASPGPAPRRIGPGFASINVTAATDAAERGLEKAAPGLMQKDAYGAFVRGAFKDLGTIGSAPFVAGATTFGLGKDIVTGHPERAAERAKELGTAMVKGAIED